MSEPEEYKGYRNPKFIAQLKAQEQGPSDVGSMLTSTRESWYKAAGPAIARVRKFFDAQGIQITKDFNDTLKNVEEILDETDINDVHNPQTFIDLAENPEIRKLVIELFKTRLRSMGRPDNAIRQEINDQAVTNASIAIVLASILLTDELNLTYQYSATPEDLAFYLNRVAKVYIKKSNKLGGKYLRKINYSRKNKKGVGTKRKNKRRRVTKRKHKKRHGTKHR